MSDTASETGNQTAAHETSAVRVKICGLTRADDARAAVRSGADAVGLIFAESRRRVSPEQARAVASAAREEAAALGRAVDVFGVFVNETAARMAEIARDVPLDVVQLHGDEPAGIARELPGLRLVKVVRVRGSESLAEVRRFAGSGAFEAVLLDTFSESARGGTGKTLDWSVAAAAAREFPVILSGGLTPGNVREAVRRVRPTMVDASGGVEVSPGEKDGALIDSFVREAKGAE
jgi:phosphoribosylanthranilate isomerase